VRSKFPGRVTRALSVRQPFATWIMDGKKRVEYRGGPTNIRERVYIYASRKPGPSSSWKKCGDEPGSLPTGVLVGTVEIVGCRRNGKEYEWKLARPKRLKRPLKPRKQPQPVWFRPFGL
jgi:predicted transcriptional regulator